MDIIFDNARIRKKCNNASGKLKRRLDDLHAAANLAVAKTLAGRCHPLQHDKKGLWAIDLDHPYRLLFKPANDPPVSKDGWIDTNYVTAIAIIRIEDYHDK